MMKMKTVAVALAMGVAAFAGLSSSADAHRRGIVVFKSGHHHHHFRHRYVTPYFVTAGPGCGVYWHRWQVTGNPYWKRRYYACID